LEYPFQPYAQPLKAEPGTQFLPPGKFANTVPGLENRQNLVFARLGKEDKNLRRQRGGPNYIHKYTASVENSQYLKPGMMQK
jgi:hypothetical protein